MLIRRNKLAYRWAYHYCIFLIGEDNLLDVLDEMMPVVNSWKAIGRGLGIDSGHLGMIQKDNPGDSKETAPARPAVRRRAAGSRRARW